MTYGRAASLCAPVVTGVVGIGAWEGFVRWRDIKPYLLPKPSLVWSQIHDNAQQIFDSAKATGTNALIGLVVGVAFGIAVALLASRARVFSEMISPLAAAVNAMPIIALAPIFYNLFTATSDTPRRLVVAMVVFFPVFVNVFKGLTQVDATQLELMRSYGAGDSAVLRKVRVPNALPFLFTGLKLAASLGVIAAIVAEYFGGRQVGLGSRITSAASNSNTGRAWAYVTASCLLGLAFFVAVVIAEQLAMPWRTRREQASR
jgi:NitT/TauT family transport system permease protein